MNILYQKHGVIAVDKPSGLLVHPSHLAPRSTETVLQILQEQIQKKLYPIHRLDRPTSGVLLLAESSAVARDLGLLMSERQISKEYEAVARGWIQELRVIDHPMKNLDTGVLQEARSIVEPLHLIRLPIAVDNFPEARYSLVKVNLETGRQHQIRRHLKHISHPIIGDSKYGKGVHNRLFRERFECSRLLLHCKTMGFSYLGEDIMITAPRPSIMSEILASRI